MKKRTGISSFLVDFLASTKKILVDIGHPIYLFLRLIIISLKIIVQVISALILTVARSIVVSRKKRVRRQKKLPKKFVFPKIGFRLPKIKTFFNLIGLLLLILIFFTTAYVSIIVFKDLPSPRKLANHDQILTTKIYDRNEKLLYKIFREKDRSPVQLSQLPKYVIEATISIEDKDFYKHPGVSWRGIARAIYQNIFKGKKSGGSTITQQLVKNVLLTSEKTWQRKAKEIVLAIITEKIYSKDQILEMYLNEVGYGGAVYGIEEATQKYFGKSSQDLNLSEAAFLAGLPASPTRYSPYGDRLDQAKTRQAIVLNRMVEDDYITEKESQKAKAQNLKFTSPKIEISAPHFVMYIKDLLIKEFGQKMVEQGGLEVKTSLDLDTQEKVQKIVTEEINNLTYLRISNGAVLVTNPKTGEILAMVGSKDYFSKEIDGNVNVTTALRQPGSSIKPVNYSIALENGFTPASLIDDSPITYKVPGQPPYSPRNYDNKFHGVIPLRIALGSSYNIPAVKILATFGVKKMIDRGREMGITSWEDPSRFGLSLTLGGGEVKMTDMAVVYGVLANNGTRVDLNPILETKDSKGKILLKSTSGKQTPVLNPGVAYLLTNILADNFARTPAFGSHSRIYISDRQVAVKTGTTQNLRDNWTIGYSPSLLAVVWVGNNDNTPMSYVASGVTGASPIWRNVMDTLLKDKPMENFPKPNEIIEVNVCVTTGTLPCDGCPYVKREFFLSGTEPKYACNPEKIKEMLEKKSHPTASPQIL